MNTSTPPFLALELLELLVEDRERLLLDNRRPEPDDDPRLKEEVPRSLSMATAAVHDPRKEAHAGIRVATLLVLVFLRRLQTTSLALLVLLQSMLL